MKQQLKVERFELYAPVGWNIHLFFRLLHVRCP
jgi:hypothetical protein